MAQSLPRAPNRSWKLSTVDWQLYSLHALSSSICLRIAIRGVRVHCTGIAPSEYQTCRFECNGQQRQQPLRWFNAVTEAKEIFRSFYACSFAESDKKKYCSACV